MKKNNTKKDMFARTAQNAYNLKHNGYLHEQIKEQKKKLEAEFQQREEKKYESGKKAGYELGRKKHFNKGYDRGYQNACDQLDDYFTILASATLLLGQVELYGYAQKRLVKAIEKQNEYIEKLNAGEKQLDHIIEELEKKGLIFKEDMLNNYLKVAEKIESGELTIK